MSARRQFLDWIVYQIYPRSFYDTNGDGIGDLNGITEKLDYLCQLGVNAVWLCPCYKSPNFDNGYDVSDYRDIMQDFGTLDDWKRMKAEMKKRGLKLIMDLVFNHTSSQHLWFQEAKKARDNPYHDYYIWADKPKNDWQSVFGGSAWGYNEETGEYYLHSFATEQPDLNWENPKVRKECADIVDFWVDMGVDGFRCDVLDFISKDFEKGKMYNGPHLHEYIRQLFDREKTQGIFTVGECASDEKNIIEICGKNRGELTTVFQFEHTAIGRKDKYTPAPFTLDDVKNVLAKWQNFAQKHDLLYTLFTDNHDQPFYLSRLGNDKTHRYACATMFATMFYLLKGIPFIYQSQEYGNVNSFYEDIEKFDDIEAIHYYRENIGKKPKKQLMKEINYGGRDNTRRPFAWEENGHTMYGFTTGTPWIAPCSRADEINLERDRKSESSVIAFYQKLLAFRKRSAAVRYGTFTDKTTEKDCFVYERNLEGESVLALCNFEKKKRISLPENIGEYRYVTGNYKDGKAYCDTFRSYEIAVYERK